MLDSLNKQTIQLSLVLFVRVSEDTNWYWYQLPHIFGSGSNTHIAFHLTYIHFFFETSACRISWRVVNGSLFSSILEPDWKWPHPDHFSEFRELFKSQYRDQAENDREMHQFAPNQMDGVAAVTEERLIVVSNRLPFVLKRNESTQLLERKSRSDTFIQSPNSVLNSTEYMLITK